jgi:hypothetical protein
MCKELALCIIEELANWKEVDLVCTKTVPVTVTYGN